MNQPFEYLAKYRIPYGSIHVFDYEHEYVVYIYYKGYRSRYKSYKSLTSANHAVSKLIKEYEFHSLLSDSMCDPDCEEEYLCRE